MGDHLPEVFFQKFRDLMGEESVRFFEALQENIFLACVIMRLKNLPLT